MYGFAAGFCHDPCTKKQPHMPAGLHNMLHSQLSFLHIPAGSGVSVSPWSWLHRGALLAISAPCVANLAGLIWPLFIDLQSFESHAHAYNRLTLMLMVGCKAFQLGSALPWAVNSVSPHHAMLLHSMVAVVHQAPVKELTPMLAAMLTTYALLGWHTDGSTRASPHADLRNMLTGEQYVVIFMLTMFMHK
jgi:hypothetical protein